MAQTPVPLNSFHSVRTRPETGSFSKWLWDHVDGTPIKGDWETSADIPAVTPLAEGISKDLKKRGMSFVGPTIIYAYLQAVGVVNDHYQGCWRYGAVCGTIEGREREAAAAAAGVAQRRFRFCGARERAKGLLLRAFTQQQEQLTFADYVRALYGRGPRAVADFLREQMRSA